MRTYSIRELGKEFGVTARTLRFYEDKGLITPERQGVTRVFSERDKVRLALTIRGRRLGFTLDEIKEIIEMYDPEQPEDPSQILYLCSKIQKYRKQLFNKINDISHTLNFMDEVERMALDTLETRYAAAGDERRSEI